MPLNNISIRSKLTLLLMTASTFGVILTCLMFYTIISRNFEKNYRASLENLASIVGENCKVALLFNISEDAQVILSSLQKRDSIVAVQLLNKNDEFFAVYRRDDSFSQALVSLPDFISSSEDQFLQVESEIHLDDQSLVGKLLIVDDMTEIRQFRRASLFIMLFVASFVILVCLFLTYFLRGIISVPLAILTKAVKRFAQGNYSTLQNIEVKSTDEIGSLSASFVDMGEKIQRTHLELEQHSHTLEERVTERTLRLKQTVDDLKKSQAQLIQSEKMAALGVLVAGVAHDINNNINFVSSAIPPITRLIQQLAKLSTGSDQSVANKNTIKADEITAEILELLESAEEGVRRTSRIVDDLTTFSRPGSGRFLSVNVHDELDKILRFLQVEFKDRVTIRKEYAENLPFAVCLPDQMSQVYTNILLNASQAIKDEGIIQIKTWLEDTLIHIRFRDNGRGIAPELVEKVFDPFFTTKDVGQGVGLGMSISFSIMKNNNGTIDVGSRVDAGTDVLLCLPTVEGKI